LAATLYHLSTNRKPVDALERSIEILDGKPDPLPGPRSLNQSVSEAFEQFLLRSLELRRENRFGTATEARDFLAPVLPAVEVPVQAIIVDPVVEQAVLEVPVVQEVSVPASTQYSYAAKDLVAATVVSQNGVANVGVAESIDEPAPVLPAEDPKPAENKDFFDDE